MNYANLYLAKLNYAHLANAKLKFAYLWQALLDGASLDRAEMNGAFLRNAKLNGAYLRDTKLNGASFREAALNGAFLRGAKLNGTDFRHAELNGADLYGAELNGADLLMAMLDGAELTSAKLNGALLSAAHLIGVSLEDAELNGADTRQAAAHGCWLENTWMRGAYFVAFPAEQRIFRLGIYYETAINCDSIPDWDRLEKDSVLIPTRCSETTGNPRQKYITRVQAAKVRADTVYSAVLNIQPDSAGFIKVRLRLACENTYAGEGLLAQTTWNSTLAVLTQEPLLEHMSCECPDSLTVIRDRTIFSGVQVLIGDFLQRKSTDK